MKAEIICVGTELLLGDILNTNAQFLSRRLAELGFNVFSQSVIGDNAKRLAAQINESLSRSEIVILSGGLGPTEDDITKEITAEVLNLPLELHTATLENIRDYFAKTGKIMSESNKKQALTIKGATVLENSNGTAPGYMIKNKNKMVILLPGPPSELIPMFEEKVVPILSSLSGETIVSHNVRIFGIGESLVAEQCGDLTDMENPTVATYAKAGEVDIRVTAKAKNEKKADEMCSPVIELIDKQFGDNIYGVDCDNLQEVVVRLLSEKKKKLATAESCTAGMLSSRITEIPGASDVFEMGVTAYANYVKVQALGVSEEIINKKGAVCPEVAAEMALGIRKMCGSDIGAGITGVAGPGESEGKPAGLVYIAITDGTLIFTRKIMCRGSNRENTRIIASSAALDMVRRYLEGREDLISRGTKIGEILDVMEGYTIPGIDPITVAKKQRSALNSASIAFSDDEFKNMLALSDDKAFDMPEKMRVSEESLNFVFDDDDDEYFEGFDDDINTEEQQEEIEDLSVDLQEYDEIEEDKHGAESKPKKEKPEKEMKKEKNNSKFGKFLRNVFPVKGDKASEIARKTVFLVALILLIGSMSYLINYFSESIIKNRQNGETAAVFEESAEKNGGKKNADGILVAFENLLKQNSDLKGWLKVKDSKIDLPVYQTSDNEFYLNHDMNKKSSRYGALFIDAENKIGMNANSKNVVIYGHSMRDGTMFGELKNFLKYDYFKQNSTIEFSSLYREGTYKVFSVFITNSLPEHDNGEVFNYRRSEFEIEEDFCKWIDDVKMRSVITTDVDVEYDDEILTLSTCAYDFDDARLVVMARRVREDSYDRYKITTASVNSNPLYPEIWYTKKGLTKPSVFSSSVNTSSESESYASQTEDASSDGVSSGISSEAGVTSQTLSQ